MKLLKIKLKNINSLKGEHEIDFSKSPLLDTGLILITGPTGSGKSTLLDAITLGLYGNVPRLQKTAITHNDISTLGTILTHHAKDAFVEIYYEVKGCAYVSKWNLKLNKNNFITSIEMQLANAVTNEIIKDQKSAVLAANEELIGLNYDQFQKSILLSQGDFAKFLQSKNEDRLKLLEKMVGTDIYRRIGKQANEHFKKLDNELKLNQHLAESIIVLTDEAIEDRKLSLTKIIEETSKLDLEINSLVEQRQKMENLEVISTKLNHAIKNASDAKLKLEAYVPMLERIKKHDELLQYHQDINNYKQVVKNVEEAKSKLTSLNEGLNKLKMRRGELLKKANDCFPSRQFVDEDFTINLGKLKTELERLEDALDQANRLIAERKQSLIKDIDSLPSGLIKSDIKKGLNQFKDHLINQLNELKAFFKEQGITEATSQSQISAMIQEIEHRKNRYQEYKRLNEASLKISNEINELKIKLEKESVLMHDNEAVMIDLIASRTALKEKIEKLIEEKTKQFEHQSYEEKRAALQDGEPCPLCGSLDHPYNLHPLANVIGLLELQIMEGGKELKSLDDRYTKTAELIAGSRSAQNLIDESLKKLAAEYTTNEKLIQTYNEIATESSDVEKIITQLDHEKVRLTNQMKQLENYRQLTPLKLNVDEFIKIRSDEMELKKNLEMITKIDKPIATVNVIASEYESLNRQFTANQTEVKIYTDTLENNQYTEVEITNRILNELSSRGYKSILEAAASIMNQKEVDDFDIEYKNAEYLCTSFESEIIKLKEEQSKLEKLVPAGIALIEMVEKLNILNSDKDRGNQSIGELKGILTNNAENKRLKEEKQKEISDQQENIRKWRILDDLIGDSTGKKYANFAQSLTLDMILDIANQKLQGFTDRYSLLRTEDDLYISDHHMANTERNVRTLSGGETFIVSLALALGLSELASQNVKLESLFIDEGFGTLDEDTLDMVVTTLEKLQQDSSKTIGIISHLDYLKDRISTQIQLAKSGNGISTFRISA
jgi:DNA repair protein SbcC/Rad50